MKPFSYNIGDWVRISYLKRTFDPEYDEKWTREFFKVVKREYMQGKQLYTLEDYAGDLVEGRFYREELQPVTVTGDEVYKIDKMIKTIKKRGQPTQYPLGWGPKFDSYIVTLSGLFTVPYFCLSFSINLSMGDNTCLR